MAGPAPEPPPAHRPDLRATYIRHLQHERDNLRRAPFAVAAVVAGPLLIAAILWALWLLVAR